MGLIDMISCYKSPSKLLTSGDLDTLLASGRPAIVAGDLNAKHRTWYSVKANTAGRVLTAYAETNPVAVLGPLMPTHFVIGTLDVLDIAILRDIAPQCTVESLAELLSDHNPILIRLRAEPDFKVTDRKVTDWEAFATILDQRLDNMPWIPANTQDDLDLEVEQFETCIAASKQDATKTIPRKWRANHDLPEDARDLIKAKRSALKRYQRTLDPADKLEANRLASAVRMCLTELRQQREVHDIQLLEPGDGSLWRKVKQLRGDHTDMPALKTGTVHAVSDADRAELHAHDLEQQYNAPPPPEPAHVFRVTIAVLQVLAQPNARTLRRTTDVEITEIVKATKRRKAPGPDGITNETLRQLTPLALSRISSLANSVMTLGHYNTRWKAADVIFIRKPHKPADFPSSYRPISLLQTLSKVIERVVLARLKVMAKDANVIPDEQFAYREGHSTELQILRVTEIAAKAANRGYATGAVFLDLPRAFDTVWYAGVLYKMIQKELPTDKVQLIASFLSSRTFKAKVGDATSAVKAVHAGVPQGAVLSPTLFAIYTSDIPRTPRAQLAMYADDTAILASSPSVGLVTRLLQEALTKTQDWLRLWSLHVNPTKSTAVCFSRTGHAPTCVLTINATPIPWCDTVRYLGVTMDNRLRWDIHLRNIKVTVTQAEGALLSLLRSGMSLRYKRLLYVTVIRPALTYACVAWCDAAPRHLQ